MEIIKPETAKEIIDGAKSIGETAAGVGSELANEAINLFIFMGILGVLKASVIFVIFGVVNKYLSSLQGEDNKNKFNALKTSALVLSLVFFTAKSFPHIVDITKALVAPKIFLLEKAADWVKPAPKGK